MTPNRTRSGKVGAVATCRRLTPLLRFTLIACLATTAVSIPSLVYSQQPAAATGSINGRVLNGATRQYLRNAQIELLGTNRVTNSGEGGEFRFNDVPAGPVQLAITYTGLDRLEQTVTVTAGSATAQEFALGSSAYGDETLQLSAYVVASAREGNAKAIVEQKQSLNFKNVVAADAFGDVTEGNVAEFLKLLPGITVDYVDADVRAVRIRGLSPKYATITLDGHSIATSASSSIDTGRQFEFEQVSLATLDIVEINKTPLADMPASGLSGSINVRSKSAFSQKGRQIKYSVSANANSYQSKLEKTPGWDNQEHYKVLPNASLEFSDTFLNDRLGLVVALNHSGSFAEQKIVSGSYTFDSNPDNNLSETPLLNSWNFQDGPKPTWRDSFVLNLDYRASDDLTFALRSSYNYYEAPFFNRNWVINANTATAQNVTERTTRSIATSATADNNSYAQVTGSNLKKWGGTFVISPSMTWRHGNLTFDGNVSYSQSKNEYDSYEQGHFSQIIARMRGVSWESTQTGDTAIAIRQLNTGATSNNGSFLDLSNYRNNIQINREERNSRDQFWTANADLTIDFDDWQMPLVVKTGADYRLNVRDIQNFNPSWTMPDGTDLGAYRETYRATFEKGETFTDINGFTGHVPMPDRWRLYDAFRVYNTDPFAVTTGLQPFNASAVANLQNFLLNQFDIKETVYSGYTMGTLSVRKDLKLIAGLRYESTETAGRSADDIGDTRAIAVSGVNTTTFNTVALRRTNWDYIVARFGTRVTREQSYDNFFPSAQLRYEPTKNLVVRAAYFSSILRPDFSSVAGGVTLSDANPPTITVRNSNLEPETADNFDARIEYYFEPVGTVSLGIFHKDIQDIQVQTSQQLDPNNLPVFLTELGFNSTNLPGGTLISQRINAGKTSIAGLEASYEQQLSFLPGAFGGLGVFANANYIKPDNEDIFALTAEDGIAKYSGSAGLSFRHAGFKAQLKANWSDERLRTINGLSADRFGNITRSVGANASRREITGEYLQIDANAEYQLHRFATVFFSVSNIFDEAKTRYLEREPFFTRYGEYGTRFTLGIKGSF